MTVRQDFIETRTNKEVSAGDLCAPGLGVKG